MLLAIAVAGVVAALTAAASAKPPPCFGAAARDAERPCDNPSLQLSATPKPEDAPLLPALDCRFVRYRQPHVCAFGAPARDARPGAVALLGDSHAPAWRAAVDVLARNRRWRALTLARSSCPFASAARRNVSDESARACFGWIRDVVKWFRRHPEVHTVFLVNSSSYDFVQAGDLDEHATGVNGYRAALDRLPPTVRHIVVIRDNPHALPGTLPCVERAIARRQRPDTHCALDRATALLPDRPTEAAAQLAGGRGHAIDLSRFFCDESSCFPVVGGALVFKDTSHITKVFSRTLGPYLAREYRALRLAP